MSANAYDMTRKFIVFEGPHGCGKSTQAELLKKHFERKKRRIVHTKEPFLEELRALIARYTTEKGSVASRMLLYLHAADRFAHVTYITGMLDSGYTVASDRYLISSCVYQQIQGLSLDLIESTNSFCIEPDLTIMFQVPYRERRERLSKAGRIRDTVFFGDKSLKAEDELYSAMFERFRSRWKKVHLLDGRRDVDNIQKEVLRLIGEDNESSIGENQVGI